MSEGKSGPQRIICLTEETTETLYLLGEDQRIVGISGYTCRPKEARQKPKVSAFTSAKIEKILELRPDLVIGDFYCSQWLAIRAVLSVSQITVPPELYKLTLKRPRFEEQADVARRDDLAMNVLQNMLNVGPSLLKGSIFKNKTRHLPSWNVKTASVYPGHLLKTYATRHFSTDQQRNRCADITRSRQDHEGNCSRASLKYRYGG